MTSEESLLQQWQETAHSGRQQSSGHLILLLRSSFLYPWHKELQHRLPRICIFHGIGLIHIVIQMCVPPLSFRPDITWNSCYVHKIFLLVVLHPEEWRSILCRIIERKKPGEYFWWNINEGPNVAVVAVLSHQDVLPLSVGPASKHVQSTTSNRNHSKA